MSLQKRIKTAKQVRLLPYQSENIMPDAKVLLKSYICCECEAPLVERWNPQISQREIKCGNDKSHMGFKSYRESKSELERKGRQMVVDNKHTELTHYSGSFALEKAEAELILKTIWPDAPKEEVFKAALICKQYGLNPLMKHIYLIKYDRRDKAKQVNGVWQKGAIVGEDWSIQIGIGATRMIARRSGAYSYEDDTPRLMTEQEQIKILGAVEPDKFWAITKLRAKDGSYAQGYGNWPKDTKVKGEDKGNTPQNQAGIRSERAALDKLFPEKLPAGVGVIAQEYEDTPRADESTGEIIERQIESPKQSASASPAPKVENTTAKQAEADLGLTQAKTAQPGLDLSKQGQVKLSPEDVDRVSRALTAAGWLPAKRQELYVGNWFKTNFPEFTTIPEMSKEDAERLIKALEIAISDKKPAKAPAQKIMPVDSGDP